MKVDINAIKVYPRFRKDKGNIENLANSINTVGLLQPIGITVDNVLVYGERRFLACRDVLGWTEIDAILVDIKDLLQAEHDENEIRKNFNVSERVAIGKAMEALLGNRQGERTELLQNFAEVKPGQTTRDIAAKKAGFGNSETYRQAKQIIEHGAPALVDVVDAGRVSINAAKNVAELTLEDQEEIVARGENAILQAARDIRSRKAQQNADDRAKLRAEALQMELPSGKYRTIIIDPPWPMQKIQREMRPNQVGFDYPTMSEAELENLDVPKLAYDQCHLFLWTTQKFLPMALRLMETWGFPYIFQMVWHKPGGFQPVGLPQFNCEFILFGRKGGLEFLETRSFPACFNAPRREHSRKPEEFYDIIRRVSPSPRIDIFSRERREGFDGWGVESDAFGGAA
ncbi:MAG: ParB N-terminal domain-containing protein [Magnetococcales bacterium]|nr:ParB N-terminal domain-containing protein [Magnetococcales bacterium]